MHKFSTFVRGTYTFNEYGNQPRTITVDGRYEVSTIYDKNHYQTVLFLKSGMGVDQIDVYVDNDPEPSREQVISALQAGHINYASSE